MRRSYTRLLRGVTDASSLVEVDRAGEKGLAKDERRDPSVAKATYPVECCNAAGDAQLERGESRRDRGQCGGLCSVTTVGEHDARNTRGDQFIEELLDRKSTRLNSSH